MRFQTSVILAGTLLLGPAAAADDAATCIGPDPDEGIPACTRVIDAAASADAVVAAYVARAKHRAVVNELDAALAALDEAIRLSPATSAESRYTRGRIHVATGDLEAALAEFDSALAVDARHVDTLISRGGAYQIAGDVDRAMADFDAAVRIDANNADALSSRGVLYLATNRTSIARSTSTPRTPNITFSARPPMRCRAGASQQSPICAERLRLTRRTRTPQRRCGSSAPRPNSGTPTSLARDLRRVRRPAACVGRARAVDSPSARVASEPSP